MADNEQIQSLLALCGASNALQENVRRTLRSLSVSPAPHEYELTPGIQTSIMNWIMDYLYGNEEFPYPYAPSVARSLENTLEEKSNNEARDEKLVKRIQSSGLYVKDQRPKKSSDGEDVHWSVFPRFYVVPKGYPTNNIEEKFAKLVGWQIVCFQQRAYTLGASYARRLNAVSEDWLLPEYIHTSSSYWSNGSLYMNECEVMLQQATDHCTSIIEEYLLKFVHDANAFTDNVSDKVHTGHNILEDYKSMQVNNAVCSTYGFARSMTNEYTYELKRLESSMLLPDDAAYMKVRQISISNSKRCAKIDWAPAFNWLGAVLPTSLSMFVGFDAAKTRTIQRAANNPAGTGTPPPFDQVFFGRHKVFDLSAALG